MLQTRANALKQLAFFDAELLLGLFPKMFNVARKRLFTSLSPFKNGGMHGQKSNSFDARAEPGCGNLKLTP